MNKHTPKFNKTVMFADFTILNIFLTAGLITGDYYLRWEASLPRLIGVGVGIWIICLSSFLLPRKEKEKNKVKTIIVVVSLFLNILAAIIYHNTFP